MLTIARVETYPLFYEVKEPYGDANGYKPYRTCFMFCITTACGIEGWGECIDWLPTLEKGFQERIIPFLIGKEVNQRQQIVKTIKKWHQRAAAGVSMALIEIIAKQANLHICDLWGGVWHKEIPVYASFQSYTQRENWLQHSLHHVGKEIEKGFTKIKVKIGGKSIKEDQEHMKSLMEMCVGQISVAIDANQSYDFAATKEWIKFFNKWENLLWLEEPMPLDQVKSYKLLRSKINIPIAGGENIKSVVQFLPLLKEGVFDIIQPDTMHEDGVDHFLQTLKLARHFGYRASPHCYDGALSRLYALFGQAVLSPWSKMTDEKIEPVEWDVMDNPFTQIIPIEPKEGMVKIPTQSGIGIQLDKERMEAYRWDGRAYV